METQKKSSKFGLGVLTGTVIGAVTAFFLSPKSGKENREMVAKKAEELKKLLEEKEIDKKVKEIFGELTDEAMTLYLQTREELIIYLSQLANSISEINLDDYKKGVDLTVKKAQKNTKKYSKQLDKLKVQMIKEWEKLKSK